MPSREHTFANDPKRKLITTPTRPCTACRTGKAYKCRITVPGTVKRKYKTVWKCTDPRCRVQRP